MRRRLILAAVAAVLSFSLVSSAFCSGGTVEATKNNNYGIVTWTTTNVDNGGGSRKELVKAACPQGFETQYGGKKLNEVAVHIKDHQGNAVKI